MNGLRLCHRFPVADLEPIAWANIARAVRLFALSTTAAGVGLWSWTLASGAQWAAGPSTEPWTLAGLTVAAVVLARLRVPLGSTPADAGLSVTVYQAAQFAAALLLPSTSAAVIGVAAPLLALQRPWSGIRIMVNGSRGLLSTLAASFIWHAADGKRGLQSGHGELTQVLAMFLALAVFAVVERGLNVTVAWLSSGVAVRSTRLLHPLEIADDVSQLSAGGVVALLVVHHPALALAASPMGLVGVLSLALHAERRRADVDGKTLLLTATAWRQTAEREVARCARNGRRASIIMIDLDFFRRVNSQLGHLGGDQVLAEVANRVIAGLRAYDVAGRFGGEEFAILLPDTTLTDAREIAERIREAVSASSLIEDTAAARVTVSAGVAEISPGDPLDSAIARADKALYRAKQDGRNRVQVHLAPRVPRQRSAAPQPIGAMDRCAPA